MHGCVFLSVFLGVSFHFLNVAVCRCICIRKCMHVHIYRLSHAVTFLPERKDRNEVLQSSIICGG